jgi:CheY-like chemotaxis protein
MKNETILVVEDEPAIREMIVTTLEICLKKEWE